jgi:hypothetical protein
MRLHGIMWVDKAAAGPGRRPVKEDKKERSAQAGRS